MGSTGGGTYASSPSTTRRRTERRVRATPSGRSVAMSTNPPSLSQKWFSVKTMISSAVRRYSGSAVAVYAASAASTTYTWSSNRPRTFRSPSAKACHIPRSFDHISERTRPRDLSANARTSSRPKAIEASRTAALAVRENLFRPGEDPFGGLAVERVAGELPRVNVVRQEACVVVQHLLEVRHDPPRIRRVSMEASADLIVDAALRHRREGAGEDLPEALFLRPMETGHDPLHRPRVRELRLARDSAVRGVEFPAQRVEALLQHRLVHGAFFDERDAAFPEGLMERLRFFQRVRLVRAVGIRHGEQDASEARASVRVLRGKIGTSVEHLAVRRQESGERPAALARDRADGLLVPRVDVGSLVPVHLDGDEVIVDDAGELRILVRFAIDDVTPVAPRGPDVQEDRPVEFFRAAERVFPPRIPLDGLVGGPLQVPRRLLREPVLRHGEEAGEAALSHFGCDR